SSRRRHTRFSRDWSSDVCSSDLAYRGGEGPLHVSAGKCRNPLYKAWIEAGRQAGYPITQDMNGYQQEGFAHMDMTVHEGRRWSRSEERRVGKECRYRGARSQ